VVEVVGEQDLKVVRLHRFAGESKLKAFADISIGDFVIKGLRVVEGQKGLFLAMPQEKAKDGKWYNVFYALNKEARQNLSEIVLAAYQE
jgi:stage V sporulation protein G